MDHPALGKAIYPNLGICLYPQAFRKYIYYIYINVYYCWWRKSLHTWDVHNPVNNGVKYLSTGAGFLPSTVAYPEGLSFSRIFFVGQLDFFYKILMFAYLLHVCLACLVCIVQRFFALTAKLKCKNTLRVIVTEICQNKIFQESAFSGCFNTIKQCNRQGTIFVTGSFDFQGSCAKSRKKFYTARWSCEEVTFLGCWVKRDPNNLRLG